MTIIPKISIKIFVKFISFPHRRFCCDLRRVPSAMRNIWGLGWRDANEGPPGAERYLRLRRQPLPPPLLERSVRSPRVCAVHRDEHPTSAINGFPSFWRQRRHTLDMRQSSPCAATSTHRNRKRFWPRRRAARYRRRTASPPTTWILSGAQPTDLNCIGKWHFMIDLYRLPVYVNNAVYCALTGCNALVLNTQRAHMLRDSIAKKNYWFVYNGHPRKLVETWNSRWYLRDSYYFIWQQKAVLIFIWDTICMHTHTYTHQCYKTI